MKKSVVRVAMGLVATIAVPIQAQANDLAQTDMPVEDAPSSGAWTDASGVISFEPPSGSAKQETPAVQETRPGKNAETAPAPAPAQTDSSQSQIDESQKVARHASPHSTPNDMFEGGSESLVARTVGAAEGTRTPDGGKTQNYHGHVDPGNGVWNRGTFSYQFGNAENLSPDESDRRQLAKIKRIYESVMLPKAEKHGVAPLTVAEEINGIDLINQASLAVTEEGGYIERLAQAKKEKGLTGDAAILDARIWAFWDADKGGWDAPGLRAYDDISKEESIRRDQDRRMAMISKALESYEQQNGDIAKSQLPQKADQLVADARSPGTKNEQSNAIADAIIWGSSN